jgi:hypothetical protein
LLMEWLRRGGWGPQTLSANFEIDIIPNTDDICLSLYIINTL